MLGGISMLSNVDLPVVVKISFSLANSCHAGFFYV